MRLKLLLLMLGVALGFALSQVTFRTPEMQPGTSGPGTILTGLEAYGPKHFSGHNEEVIIRHFFRDRKAGFFLDVGAFHYSVGSNTYYLEKFLGWKGIAIDANAKFASGYKAHRPRTVFLNLFVSDRSDESITFNIVTDPGHPGMSTAEPSFIKGIKAEQIRVPTISLNDLLQREGINKVDFVSLDIELWEPRALAGFDIGRYKPELVCVEAHHQVRDQILAYFVQHGYARMDLYFLLDQRNWYFTPRENYVKIFSVSF